MRNIDSYARIFISITYQDCKYHNELLLNISKKINQLMIGSKLEIKWIAICLKNLFF